MQKTQQVQLIEIIKKCEQEGVKITPKRQLVLQGLIDCQKALSAYDLIQHIQDEYGKTFQSMSMYRILDVLEAHQIVHKLNTVNKYILCAHLDHHHTCGGSYFIVCRNCSDVREVKMKSSDTQRISQLTEQQGFEQSIKNLEINAVCKNCA